MDIKMAIKGYIKRKKILGNADFSIHQDAKKVADDIFVGTQFIEDDLGFSRNF